MKQWFKNLSTKTKVLLIAGILIIGGAAGAVRDQNEPEPEPTAVEETAESESEPAGDEPEPEPAEQMTEAGIGFFEAAGACDNYLILQMPGREYKSHLILGKRSGNIGLEPDQFIAVYDATIDGAPMIVSCVVDGEENAVNVLKVELVQK